MQIGRLTFDTSEIESCQGEAMPKVSRYGYLLPAHWRHLILLIGFCFVLLGAIGPGGAPAATVNEAANVGATGTVAEPPVTSPEFNQVINQASRLPAADRDRLANELNPTPSRDEVRKQLRRLEDPDRRAVLSDYTVTTAAQQWLLGAVGLTVALLAAVLIGWMRQLQGRMFAEGTPIKDLERLPLGLPPGSIRAVLAILVIATALLLFVLGGAGFNMPESLIGIVGMVLGFYFGTRNGAGDELQDAFVQQAQELGQQRQEATAAREQADQLRGQASETQNQLDDATQRLRDQQGVPTLDALLAQGARRVTFGADLVASLRDSGLGLDVAAYETAVQALSGRLEAAKAASPDAVTTDQRREFAAAIAGLPDRPGDAASLLGGALQAAAPLFAGTPVNGTADDRAKLALLLTVGAALGSAAYQRWKARMLWAPVGQLIDPATFSEQDIDAAAELVPVIQDLPPGDDRKRFLHLAAGMAVVDSALLEEFGPEGATPLVDNIEGLAAVVRAFRQELLGRMARQDITADACNTVSRVLSAATSILRVEDGRPTQQEVAGLLDAAAAASSMVAANDEEQEAESATANLHALVTLVDLTRRDRIDLATVLAELSDTV